MFLHSYQSSKVIACTFATLLEKESKTESKIKTDKELTRSFHYLFITLNYWIYEPGRKYNI